MKTSENKKLVTHTCAHNDWFEGQDHLYDDDGQGAELYSQFGGNGDWYLCLRSVDMVGNFHHGGFRISLSGTQIDPTVRAKLIELCKMIYRE